MKNQKIIEYEKKILEKISKNKRWKCIDRNSSDAISQIDSALTKCHLIRYFSTASFIFFCLEDK